MNQVVETTEQLETCPFCKSEVKAEATVCADCGAFKGIKPITGADQLVWIMFILVPAFLGFVIGAASFKKEILLGIAFCASSLFWFIKGSKWIAGERKVEWLRRH